MIDPTDDPSYWTFSPEHYRLQEERRQKLWELLQNVHEHVGEDDLLDELIDE